MSLLFILFTGFTIGISGAAIPGPFTLFTASETLRTDKFAGFKSTFGHIIIEFTISVLIFFGFYKVFINKSFLFFVSVIGGLAFIVMGTLLFVNAGKMKLSNIGVSSEFNKGTVLGGIFFSIASPGFLVWWATIGLSTIAKASLFGIIGVIVLAIGHWTADLLWYGLLSYAIDKGKVYLTDRRYRNVIRFLSAALIILGFHFLIYRAS